MKNQMINDQQRDNEYQNAKNQNKNAIQVGGVSVEMDDAQAMQDNMNFADY